MRYHKSMMSIAVGSVLATGLSAASVVHAADASPTANNPFEVQSLNKGYMIAYADRADPAKYGMGAKEGAGAKAPEGRCGYLFLLRGYSSGKNSARIRAASSRLHANGVAEVLQILVRKQ